jgi:hypothetical protein
MIATWERCKSPDVRDSPMFKDVSINNDVSETVFPMWDGTVGKSSGAGLGAVRSAVFAKLSGAILTDSQRRQKAREVVRQALKTGSLSGDEDEETEKEYRRQNLQNYENTPPELRWEILKEIRRRYKVLYFLPIISTVDIISCLLFCLCSCDLGLYIKGDQRDLKAERKAKLERNKAKQT